MSEDKVKNIYQRINAVMAQVTYVQKDADVRAGQSSYKAVTHDMVVSVLRKSMVDHGIVVKVSQLKGKYIERRDLSRDIKQNFYTGTYEISFVNIDDTSDRLILQLQGHASDSGDKAPNKAISTAVKYALLKVFSLETGENEESRAYEAPAYTEIQQDDFNAIIDSDNGLRYAVFSRKVGPEVMAALQKTFPAGQISAKKKQCKELELKGWDILREYAEQIKVATDADDSSALVQLIDELDSDEKRVLAGILRPEDIDAIKKAKEL
jgi:hypothetical protein